MSKDVGERKSHDLGEGSAAFPLLPERYWLKGTEGTTWDPVVLRARCEAHRGHSFDHKVDGMHPGVVLYLLDVWEKAREAVEHIGPTRHITMVELREAVHGE